MPFIDEQPAQEPVLLQAPLGVEAPPERPAPTAGETFAAAFDRENAVVGAVRLLMTERDPVDLSYNPYDDERIKESEFATDERVSRLYSRGDTDRFLADMARERKDQEVLAASGALGLIAQVSAGVADPTIFIPGGALVKAKRGYSAIRSSAMIGTAASGQVAIQEGILQASQQDRGASESVLNISSAALLAGIFGAGAAKLLSAGERKVLTKALDAERKALGGLTGGSVGAAATDAERTGLLKPFVPVVVSENFNRAKDMVAKVPGVGPVIKAVAELPEKLALKSNPMLRMATSESSASRKALGDLAAIPLETIDNAKGITTSKFGVPLDLDVKLTVNRAETELYEAVHKLYSEYRFGGNVRLPGARDKLEKAFGKSELLAHDDFMAEVDSALRNGDRHEIPQVAALAKTFRKWLDTTKDMARQMGIDIGDDVLGAESFAPRVYDRIALTRERPEFVKRYVEYRKGEQVKKSAQKLEIENQWNALMRARADQRKIDARLATADQRVAELEARLSEREKEAGAAIKRAMTVSERDREAKAALQEAQDFLASLKEVNNSAEIRQQISDLEDEIAGLQSGSAPRTLEDLEAIDAIERKGILTGDMRRVARVLTGREKMPEPPSFWKWVRSKGGIRDFGGDMSERPKGLILPNGREWDDLQFLMAEEFPELRQRGWAGTDNKPIEDFSNEIRDYLSDSMSGKEPEWFLAEKWSPRSRFVAETAAAVENAAGQAGIVIRTMKDVEDVFTGRGDGSLTEADYDAMIAGLETSRAGTDFAVAAADVGNMASVRAGSMAIIKDMLEQAKGNLGKARSQSKTAGAVTREAGVAGNRNMGRLRILHERAMRADGIKIALERAMALAVKSETEAMANLEARLGEWEGKSTSGVKGALARRAERDAERTPEQKAAKPRLASADREIARSVRRILRGSQDKMDSELVSEAEQTVNQILSTPDGRLPKDEPGTVRQVFGKNDVGDLRGSLNERKLPMQDNELLPFLVRNPLDYTMRYIRQSMADLGMVARFGDTEGSMAMKEIADDYANMIRNAGTPERRVELQKRLDGDIRDFAAMRDRIKGTYGFSSDAFLQTAGRVAESVKSFNVMTLMGGSGLAQFPDFAGVIFRHGFQSAFKDGFVPFFARLTGLGGEKIKAARAEYGAFGVGAETFQSTRYLDAMDLNDTYHHRTPFERVLRGGATGTMVLAGTTLVTDAQKTIAATVAGHNLLSAARAISEGKASQKQISMLAAGNIDAPRAEAIWKAFSNDGGSVVDGTFVPTMANWKDAEAQRFFEAAVLRDVEIAVITPGQEKPLLLSSPILSLLGQFKTFVAAANTRILLANMQRRDATTLSGLVASVGLGMTAYAAYTVAKGGQFHDRPQDWIKEGVDRSGVLGWFSEANSMSAKATGGQADLFRVIGADKPLSRYQSRGLLGNMLGPGFGLAEDATGLAYAASNGGWTESDTRKVRRLLPFQNLFYLRRMIDEVERNSNQMFGIEQKAAND